ncbi:MAG: DUF1015 domain-containing protein [Firmicutes bacterium]|nr:DUF1015 domain-containing protein [Bacillota bacterium]
MARIAAFRGLRYNEAAAGPIETLVCPPYDIISPEEEDALRAKNPYNMVRLELPRGPDKYAAAARCLRDWQAGGQLRRDERECLYLYEEEFSLGGERRKISGVIARVTLEDFSAGVILPHEETLSKAKEDRLLLMRETFCNFSPVYSLYHDGGAIQTLLDGAMLEPPEIEFSADDGATHRLWVVSDPAVIAVLTAAFAALPLFIADGHHRYETALRFRGEFPEADTIMMMLVDMNHPGLAVLPTHRLVRGITGFRAESVLHELAKIFDIREKDGDIAFYTGGRFYYLTLKDRVFMKHALPDKSVAYRSLDVAVLHSLILEPVFGIDSANMAEQKNLSYTRSAEEAIAGVDSGAFQCAFLLDPTKVSQIRDVSLAGEKMPQKSTYFYPKLSTGLVIHVLRQQIE